MEDNTPTAEDKMAYAKTLLKLADLGFPEWPLDLKWLENNISLLNTKLTALKSKYKKNPLSYIEYIKFDDNKKIDKESLAILEIKKNQLILQGSLQGQTANFEKYLKENSKKITDKKWLRWYSPPPKLFLENTLPEELFKQRIFYLDKFNKDITRIIEKGDPEEILALSVISADLTGAIVHQDPKRVEAYAEIAKHHLTCGECLAGLAVTMGIIALVGAYIFCPPLIVKHAFGMAYWKAVKDCIGAEIGIPAIGALLCAPCC